MAGQPPSPDQLQQLMALLGQGGGAPQGPMMPPQGGPPQGQGGPPASFDQRFQGDPNQANPMMLMALKEQAQGMGRPPMADDIPMPDEGEPRTPAAPYTSARGGLSSNQDAEYDDEGDNEMGPGGPADPAERMVMNRLSNGESDRAAGNWPATAEAFRKLHGRDPSTDAEMEHYYGDGNDKEDDGDPDDGK